MLARAVGWLDTAAFSPDTLPDDLVIGLALAPPVIAGLIIFKVAALEMLLVALGIGIVAQLASRLVWRGLMPRPATSPLIAALVGVALIGAGAPRLIAIEIAILASVLEVLRGRFTPAVNLQTGLIAYICISIATRGAPLTYVNPNGGKPLEPFAIWRLFPAGAVPIDPIRLYVGNVPGPVFATSLMAVAIGVAWLAYARRLNPIVAASFALGALLPIAWFHWDFLFQLDSGPTWFVGALILSDRRTLPSSGAGRPVLAFAAGIGAIGLRNYGVGVDGAYYAVAAVQVFTGLIAVSMWAIQSSARRRERARLLRKRDEQLRAINRTEDEAAGPRAVAS